MESIQNSACHVVGNNNYKYLYKMYYICYLYEVVYVL